MASALVSEFPKYLDGDVIIVITSTKTYQLHASILRRNSPFFAQLLTEQAAAHLLPRAVRAGVTVRYRAELNRSSAGGIGYFELKVRPAVPYFVCPDHYSPFFGITSQSTTKAVLILLPTFSRKSTTVVFQMSSTNTGTGSSAASIIALPTLMTKTLPPYLAVAWD